MSRRFAINLAAFFCGFFLIIAAGAAFATTLSQAMSLCNQTIAAGLSCGAKPYSLTCSNGFMSGYVNIFRSPLDGPAPGGSCSYAYWAYTPGACDALVGQTFTNETFYGYTPPGTNAATVGTMLVASPIHAPASVSANGCEATATDVSVYVHTSNYGQAFEEVTYSYTGAVSVPAELAAPPLGLPPTPCQSGFSPGTVNGVSSCYASASPPPPVLASPTTQSQTAADNAAAAATSAVTAAAANTATATATAGTAASAATTAASAATAAQSTATTAATAASAAQTLAVTAANAYAASPSATTQAAADAAAAAASAAQQTASNAAMAAQAASSASQLAQLQSVNASNQQAAAQSAQQAAQQAAATAKQQQVLQQLSDKASSPAASSTPSTSFCADNPTAAECVAFSAPASGALPSTAATWYTSKYPGGITALWDSHSAALFASPLGSAIANMAVPVGSGSIPTWTFSFWGIAGTYTLAIPSWLWAVLKAIVLLSAAFACRAIIFGG